MGIIEFFLFVILVVGLGYLTIYALGKFAPGHPPMIDNIVWIVVILFIIVMFASALGLTGFDPQIPRVRG